MKAEPPQSPPIYLHASSHHSGFLTKSIQYFLPLCSEYPVPFRNKSGSCYLFDIKKIA